MDRLVGKYKIKKVIIPETRYKVIDTETDEERLVKRGITINEIEDELWKLENKT